MLKFQNWKDSIHKNQQHPPEIKGTVSRHVHGVNPTDSIMRLSDHNCIAAVFELTHLPEAGTSKTGFGKVKIMKEFVLINRFFFLNLAFRQVHVGEKN